MLRSQTYVNQKHGVVKELLMLTNVIRSIALKRFLLQNM